MSPPKKYLHREYRAYGGPSSEGRDGGVCMCARGWLSAGWLSRVPHLLHTSKSLVPSLCMVGGGRRIYSRDNSSPEFICKSCIKKPNKQDMSNAKRW